MKRFAIALLPAVLALVTGCSATHVGQTAHKAEQAQSNSAETVVFMGDSITQNWAVFGGDEFSSHPGYVDAGYMGDDSGQMVNRFYADVVAKHPRQVVILAGTNDVYAASFMLDNNWNTPNNITWMVNVARANDIVPILATMPPWGCAASNCSLALKAEPQTATHLKNTATVNAWIQQYAFDQSLICLDFHSKLVSADGETYKPELTLDGIHPSAAGYALMNPMVEDAITVNERK